jgi:hypothetical protein
MNTMKPLAELVEDLPPDKRTEVRDFVEFLLAKPRRRTGRILSQEWAGALRDYREQYSSLQLERQALVWREA